MRYNAHSTEESCGRSVQRGKYDLACLRTKGHLGECEPEMGKAGEADGVRWCCRVRLERPHESWCPLLRRDDEDVQ